MAPYGIHLDPNKAVIDIIAAAFIMAVMMAHHRKTSHPTNLNQLPKGARKKESGHALHHIFKNLPQQLNFHLGRSWGNNFKKKWPAHPKPNWKKMISKAC